jgi:aspartyl protease family protein
MPLELDPRDRLPRFDEDRFSSSTKIVIWTLLVVIAVFGGGFSYWYYVLQRPSYAHVYSNLGIAPLPIAVEAKPKVQSLLDQLSREPCYRDAMYGLADALLEAGYPRETDTSLFSFAKRCRESNEILGRRYTALIMASDFSAAFRVADDLVSSNPASAQARYWRGNAYKELKDFAHALTDYINTVQLMGHPSTISVKHYYAISQMYDALGRHCEAITPIETFLSFNPDENQSTQWSKLIAEYAEKGNCDAHYATGTARIARVPFPGMIGLNTLDAVINGIQGKFLLDTGATYVAVTNAFASKAKLSFETGTQLPMKMKTVGGSAIADLAYANTVAVGKAEARRVPVAVIQGASDPFDGRLDGLLGMSFLARFKLNISQNTIDLTALPLRY